MDASVRIGVLTPHQAIGPEEEFPAMAPGQISTRVVRLPVGEQRSGLVTLTGSPVLDGGARTLAAEPIDVVVYASTTTGYAIGFESETAVESRLSRLTGVPAAATGTSAVHALHILGAKRIALVGAPWFDPEHNQRGAAYFSAQGFEVVSSRSAGLSQDPRAIEPADLAEWMLHHVEDSADVAFVGGNGFRAAQAIPMLEAGLGRPVITANQVLLWKVLALTSGVQIEDRHGQLFAREP